MKKTLDRRSLLSKSLSFSAIGLASLSSAKSLANACNLTAEQPEGPFYPEEIPLDHNSDLTLVTNRPTHGPQKRAKGEYIILRGIVKDQQCHPIKGAMVEIWQACHSGKYNHSSDPNTATLDPDFQYYGKSVTNDKGEYYFITVKPGKYKATETWIRPPHIHLKAHLRGHLELTTQVYFSEDTVLNSKDKILQGLPTSQRKALICEFKKNSQSKFRTGQFDITLKSLT